MKIKDLPASKGGLIGTRLSGMKNLARHAEFPELVTKRATDVKAAVHFGGVLIDVGTAGMLFYACQNVQELLDTEILLPGGVEVEVREKGVLYNRGDIAFMDSSILSTDETNTTGTAIVEGNVVKWCAVVTPCQGYGHAKTAKRGITIKAGETGMTASVGSFDDYGNLGWGQSTLTPDTTATSYIVLWRDVPLRKTVGEAFADEEFSAKILDHYPEVIRKTIASALAEEVEKNANVALSICVSYTRGADGKKRVGFGLENAYAWRTTRGGKVSELAIQYYGAKPNLEVSDFAEPPVLWSIQTDGIIDIGFRSFDADGKRQWNALIDPAPVKGWVLTDGAIPKTVAILDTKVNMRGIMRDFLPQETTPTVMAKLSEAEVKIEDVPHLRVGRDLDNTTGEASLGLVTLLEPVGDNDYLVVVPNMLARAEASVGDGRTYLRRSGRIWEGSEAISNKMLKTGRYRLQMPGSKWETPGSSKSGSYVLFDATGELVLTTRRVNYSGASYLVVDITRDGALIHSFAELDSGKTGGQSSSSARGTVTIGDIVYGKAATSTTAPGPGALFEVSGTAKLVATLAQA